MAAPKRFALVKPQKSGFCGVAACGRCRIVMVNGDRAPFLFYVCRCDCHTDDAIRSALETHLGQEVDSVGHEDVLALAANRVVTDRTADQPESA
jgi:hypothetical protein